MERICTFGDTSSTHRFDDFRLERRGFLSLISCRISGFKHRFEIMERGHAVAVLPISVKKRELYMIEQPRPARIFTTNPKGIAAISATLSKKPVEPFEMRTEYMIHLGLPAGIVDPDETPLNAAVRELEEETGLIAPPEAFTKVAHFYPSIGSSTESITTYIASLDNGYRRDLANGDVDERIIVWKLSWDEAFEALRDGRIDSASSCILVRELRIMDLEGRTA